jgi:hypothetical protein
MSDAMDVEQLKHAEAVFQAAMGLENTDEQVRIGAFCR